MGAYLNIDNYIHISNKTSLIGGFKQIGYMDIGVDMINDIVNDHI